MPIQIRRVLPTELDILKRCAQVETDAFAASHVTPVVFPGPFPPGGDEHTARQMATDLREDPNLVLFAAFDTDVPGPDAVTGWAKWHIHEDALPKPKERKWGPGINVSAAQAMFGAIDGLRERNMSGKPCVYLSVLVVHSAHQGRGVGRQLLSWGLQEATRLGLPCFLESSAAGKALYDKSGFKVIESAVVPFDEFDHAEPFRCWAMLWEVPSQRCP